MILWIIAQPKSNLKNTAEEELRIKSTKFAQREINAFEFRDYLKANNINSNTESINKFFRINENGGNIRLNELINTVSRIQAHPNSEFKNMEAKPKNFMLEQNMKDTNRNVVMSSDLTSP